MHRTTFLPAAALLGATLLAPTGATAAGETCQGIPATHVGSENVFELEGTEGADVIVTNGAQNAQALGGNDLVCITVASSIVDAGAGDDVVWALDSSLFQPRVELGPGSDRFTGSAADDTVWAGSRAGRDIKDVHHDVDRDVIDGGPASEVYGDVIISGERGAANADEVRLIGGFLEFLGTPAPQAVVDGGGGSTLTLDTTDARSASIDTTTGTYAVDGTTAPATGFDQFQVADEDGPRSFSFRGSDRNEFLSMEFTLNPAYDIDMSGGDDDLFLRTDRIHRRVTSFDGGAGHDQIGIVMPQTDDVRLDLRHEQLLTGKVRRAVPAVAAGFEDASVVGKRIVLVGTGEANDLRTKGCHTTVRALGGADKVSPDTILHDQVLTCRQTWARLEGGAGADRLVGDRGVDILIGGPGRDVADGGGGRDVCRAEKTRRCEVRG